MRKLNIFDDNRKIPKININVRIKIKSNNTEELKNWNTVFGYIMKKPRTKLDFINVKKIRQCNIKNLTLDDIYIYLSQDDYYELSKIQNIFNSGLTTDLKAFILSVIKVPIQYLEAIQE